MRSAVIGSSRMRQPVAAATALAIAAATGGVVVSPMFFTFAVPTPRPPGTSTVRQAGTSRADGQLELAEVRRPHLAALLVEVLQARVAEAHRRAAVDLHLVRLRVDDLGDVDRGEDLEHLQLPGLGVDRDLGDLHAVGADRRRRLARRRRRRPARRRAGSRHAFTATSTAIEIDAVTRLPPAPGSGERSSVETCTTSMSSAGVVELLRRSARGNGVAPGPGLDDRDLDAEPAAVDRARATGSSGSPVAVPPAVDRHPPADEPARGRGRLGAASADAPPPGSRSPRNSTQLWPFASRSPVRSRFRRRSSTGSMPTTAASSSSADSVAKLACGEPGARMWPFGTVLV